MRSLSKSLVISPNSTVGFTLVEMLMVVVLIGVLAGLTAPIISQGLTASNMTSSSLQTLEKLRYATERLAREIRQIDYNGAGYNISQMTANRITFVKNSDGAVTVDASLTGSVLSLGYSSPAVTAILTDEVSALNFSYLNASGSVTASTADLAFVEISLTLLNPNTSAVYSQRTRVALRDRS
jgi:prepilin-type N-terminal cleavage/methylation domain-containing protein